MATAKNTLRDKLERLTEEQAARVLRLMDRIAPTSSESSPLAGLRNDATFGLPVHGQPAFKPVRPIEGNGDPASEILLHGRR